MAQSPAAEKPSSSRQAARERAFRLLALTVTALFLAFAALGGASFWYDRAAGLLTHTHEVRAEIEGVRQALTEAESAQRAYVLTGRAQFAEQVEGARAEARRRYGALEALTALAVSLVPGSLIVDADSGTRTLTIQNAGRFDGCPPSWDAKPSDQTLLAQAATATGAH